MKWKRAILRLAKRNEAAGLRQSAVRERRFLQKTAAVTTAFTLLANPLSALAAIESENTSITTVTQNGGLYEVESNRRFGNNAVNVFKQFGLNANEIANLYFGTKADNSANNLFNFVNARIDVNGTINAIKNNKIGGNLYFLSKDGLFVGSSGVINTGSLYVMTPAGNANALEADFTYDRLKEQFVQNGASEDLAAYKRVIAANIPLNADATISVLGKINATNNIGLYAPKIAVGKDLRPADQGGTGTDVVTTASLQTGVTDFSAVVNTTGSSGLTGDALKASRDTDTGDIILAAKAEYANTKDDAFNNRGTIFNVINSDKRTITASVENHGSIEAARDAKLTATATNGNLDLALERAGSHPDYEPVAADDAQYFAQTVAKVDVTGAVKSARDTVLKAEANNTYIDTGKGINKLDSLLGMVGINLDANVTLLDSQADIKISNTGSVNAGGQADITANSTLSNTVGLDVGGMALVNIGGLHSSVAPAVGVAYSKATNNAAVTVDGEVKAAQDLTIAAKAEETEHVTATVATSKALLNEADPSALVTAVNVSESDNHAKVTLNHAVQSTGGNVAITADTQTSLATTAAAGAADESMGSAAVNVTLHDSSATVDINQTVTAAGSLKVDAANILHENTVIASNVHGWGKFQADLMKAVNIQGIASAAESRLPTSITDKLSFLKGKDGDQPSPISNLFSAGAAIAVADESNKARVAVADTAGLQAGGDLSVNAKLLLEDTHMTANAKTSSFKETAEKTVTIAAGFVYAGMDNSAEVDIKDRAAKADNVKLSGKNISITSSTVMEYNRINRMIREVERAIDKLEQAIREFDNYSETASGNGKTVKDRLVAIKDSMVACKNSFISDQSPDAMTNGDTLDKIAITAQNAWHILTEAQALGSELGDLTQDLSQPFAELAGGAVSVVTGALAFIEPSNYANFSAGAAAAGGKDTQLSAAGSVSITNIDHTSRIRIGRNAELTAINTLAVDSRNKIADVNTTGKMMFWTPSAAGGPGAAIGGSFNYQDFDTRSLVAVAEAASLKGGDIKLTSDSDIFHVGAMLSAGMTDGSAISGMASFTNGDSTNAVSVDDGAVITAAKGDADNPDTKDNTGLINLAAVNNTSVNNAIVSFVVGGGSAGVGVGVAINNLGVNNLAAIGDNSQGKVGGIDLAGLFGNDWQSTDSGSTGKLAAQDLTLTAATGGIINAAAIAGGATYSSDDPSPGIMDKIAAPFKKLSDLTKGNVLKGITAVSGKLQDSLNAMSSGGKAQGAPDPASVPAAPAEGGGTPTPTTPETPEANVPQFTLSGAGSVAVNLVDNHTKAIIDNANIELDDGKLSVGAKDSAFIGAWSGSAAISWRGGQNSNNTSVAFAGAVGVNDVNGETTALVKNSQIDKAKDIDIVAASGGTQSAAGLTATFTKGGSGSNTGNYSGAASVSVNLIDRSTSAALENSDVNKTIVPSAAGNLDVTAYARDVQVTGGINAHLAATGGNAGGAAVTVADISNKLNASIKDSQLDKLNNAQVQSLLATTQVTVAASVGAATGGSGGSSNNTFSGAVIYNGLSNQANAALDGTVINAAGGIGVNAQDTSLNSADAKKYQDWLGSTADRDTTQFNRSGLGQGGADGTDYYKNLNTDAAGDGNKALDLNNHGKTGSTIITAALVGVGSDGNAAGAAVNIGNIDNNFAAGIKNSTITANQVNANANADTLLVGVAGGVAAGTKTFGGMGSVSWQTIDNTVAAAIDKSTLTTNVTAVNAANSSLVVNTAGQVTVGKTAALGATLAYNAINNQTGAAIQGSELAAMDAGKGMDIAVTAAGETDIYGIGASVAASTGNTAVSGTVVINRGKSTAQAAIDQDDTGKRSTLTNVKHLDVQTADTSKLTAAVANVNAGSKVAIGAGVAVNDIGGSISGRQDLAARLDKSDITTVADSIINVTAEDKARLITIAAGVGGSGKVAVQGAAATALVNKQLSASMTDTNIDKATDNADKTTVKVSADNQSDIYTAALVAAGSGTAAIGAGVGVNSIQQGTVAQIDGGTQNVRDLLLTTKAAPTIYTAGIGGGVAGTAGIAGSVAVNMIENNSAAKISGDAQITAQNNIGLVAESDELITNYAGVLSGGGTASIGASVSVNEINGNTVAAIEGTGKNTTKVTALGKAGSVATHGKIDDSAIVNTVFTDTNFDPTDNLKNKRQTETKTGIVVDASGTRNIRSVLANVSGSGTAALAGTVNVNKIDGSTAAGIKDASLTGGNVSVRADDYTNSAGFVGTGAGSGNAAVGLSSDTNLINRATSAKISGSTIKALDLTVNAIGKQGISSYGAGIAAAVEGAGIAGTVGVVRLNAKTAAELIDTEADVSKLDIKADHLGRVNLGAGSGGLAGIGAGAGLAVGVADDSSVTEALVTNSHVTSKDHTTIRAFNTTGLKTYITSLGVGGVGAGVSGSVSVNNINSQIRAKVTGSDLTLNSNSGKVMAIEAANTLNIDANTGGLAAGAAGVGASVSVNTVDSQVEAAVTGATLTNNDASGQILVNADETRDIRQFAVNAAAGVGALSANIMVTNVGKALSAAGGDDAGDNAEGDAAGEVKKVNGVYDGQNLLSEDFGARETGKSSVTQADLAVNAGQGKDNGSLIKAVVNDSDLKANGNINIKATETDKIDINSGNVAIGVGGPSFNASVGILNVNRNTAVDLLNTTTLWAAKDININTLVQDKDFGVRLNMLQGTGSIYSAGLSAGYARLRTQGTSNIDIADSVLTAKDNIFITAADQGHAEINAKGLTVGSIAVGVIVADAANDSDVAVNLDYSGFYADNTSVTADKMSTVTANAMGGAVGIGPVAAVGVAATAADNGQSTVTVHKGSLFQGRSTSLLAQNSPAVKANAGSLAAALTGAGGVSVAIAKATGTANLNVLDENTFANDIVNFNAIINTQNDKATAQADAAGLAVSVIGGLDFNLSQAETATAVNVTVDRQYYRGSAALTISGRNDTKQQAETKSLTIGGVLAAGSNKAETKNTGMTIVNAKGGAVGSLTVNAVGSADNTALADGSGGGLVAAGAAIAENTMNSDTIVNLSGDWSVGGSLTANASQTDTANINADSVRGGAFAINGAKATNTIGNKDKGTAVNILGGASLNAADINLTAKNNLAVNNRQTYMVEGASYGAMANQDATAKNTVDKKAAVNAGLGSRLTARTGDLTLAALTEGNVNSKASMKTAGLVATVNADNTNTVTVNNAVTLAKGVQAETQQYGGDVTLAASDKLDVTAAATADNQGGAAGGSTAVMMSTLNRNNAVRVDGAIRSLRDVNLYAGTGADGAKTVLKLNAAAEAYNKSVIAAAKPALTSMNNQANQVTVSGSGTVDSVRHINLAANQGREYVTETSASYTWYQGEDTNKSFTGTAAGIDSKGKHSDNAVQLDGKLTAGTQNKLNITVSGTVAPPGGTVEGSSPLEIIVNTGNAAYDNELKGKITTGTIDYGNELFVRWRALGEIISEYSGKDKDNKELAAYVGYLAEQERVFNQMKALGLVTSEDVTYNGKTTTVYHVIDGFKVNSITLPNLAASGGNIVIDADNLAGSGSLIAKGAPEINITNNSSYYMKINDAIIGDKGGEIKFNNTILTGDSAIVNAAIKAVNKDQTKAVSQTVISDGPDGVPQITITSNWNSPLNVTYTNPANSNEKETISVKPLTSIEINGAIENKHGKIEITNQGGDILIQGKSDQDNASVQGQEIVLNAANGSVTQGYVDGIVNIGGTPEDDWNRIYEMQRLLVEKYNDLNTADHREASLETKVGTGGSWVAGDSIYINAADINVNGLIQSGYDTYRATISQAALDNAKNASLFGSQAVVINGETLIKINDGNTSVYDSAAGKYIYEVQAYYNPRTGKIVVDDIATKGGQVYLTGRIASTGVGDGTTLGRIIALDGGANITIVNDANADLQLGSIANNNIAGLIKITDLNTNTVTEYTRTATKVSDLSSGSSQVSAPSGTYNVKAGLRYNWVRGRTQETTATYQSDVTKGMWGGYAVGETTWLTEYEKSNQPVVSVPGGSRDRQSGSAFIEAINVADNTYDYALIFDNAITSQTRSPVEHWRTSSGFLGWYKHDHYRWTVKTGSSQTYLNTLKADKPINISFIGQTDGTIGITGKQNVELLGDIKNNTSAATLQVAAGNSNSFGAISQLGGSIYGGDVKLTAVSGINDINITSQGDTVRLYADNAKSGNISISVDGGWANNQQFAGNIDLLRAVTGPTEAYITKGNISLTARGNITQSDDQLKLLGNRIDLTSTQGAIGTAGQALVLWGGQEARGGDSLSASVNATAKGDIHLAQSHDNMRVGIIDSAEGDVTLTVRNGSFVDALPAGQKVEQDTVDKKLQGWKDLGLIAGDGAFTQKRAQQAANYKSAVEADYQTYLAQKTYYDSHADQKNGDAYKAYQELETRFKAFGSAQDYLNADKAYQDLTKTLTEADYKWTQNQLLYALQDAMINKEGGSTQSEIKAANISGRNITLTASNGGIGIDTGAVTITDFSNVDNLKQLANAEASDVTWTKNANGQFQSATINGKSPLGIHTRNNGVLNAAAKDNIYIAGRTEGQDTPLYIDKVTTDNGNIRVLGKAGVFSVNTNQSSPNFSGKDLILEGGTKDIGTINNAIRTALSGQLTARTDGSAYIRDISGNGFTISSIYAGDNLWVRSSGAITSFYNTADPNDPLNLGRITAKHIDIESTGANVGTAGNGLRITNQAAADAAEATTRIVGQKLHLKGITAPGEEDGTLVLTEITATDANGIIGIDSTDNIALTGDITAANTIRLNAQNGSIRQTDGKKVAADNLDVTATAGIELQSANNTINKLTAANDTGTIQIKNTGINGLTVTVSKANAGAVNIENQTGALTVNAPLTATGNSGSITLLNHNGSIHAQAVTADHNTLLQTDTGDIKLTGGITAGHDAQLQTQAGNITFTSVNANQNANIKVTREGDITGNNAEATSGTLTVETTKGAIKLGKTTAGTDLSLSNQNGGIELTDVAKAGQDAKLQTATGDIQLTGGMMAGHDAQLQTQAGNIELTGAVTAGQDAKVQIETGNITFADVTANRNADIKVNQQGDITGHNTEATIGTLTVETAQGAIKLGRTTAGTDISLTNQNGGIDVTDVANAGQDVQMQTAAGNITFISVNANQNADIKVTQQGDITGNNTEATSGTLTVETAKGAIKLGKTTAGTDLSLSNQNGNIELTGDATAGQDAKMQTGTGNIQLTGGMMAGNDVLLQTTTGNITFTDVTANRNADINVTQQGNIIGASLQAKNGGATVGTAQGAINITAAQAKGLLSLTNQAGNIKVGIAGGTDVSLLAKVGDIEVQTVTADNDALLQTDTGNITFTSVNANQNADIKVIREGDITGNNAEATSGTLTVETAKGAIKLGKTTAGTDLSLSNQNGGIELTDVAKAGQDAKLQTVIGNITFADVTANGNADIKVTQEGNITGASLQAKNGKATVSTPKGAIDLTAAQAKELLSLTNQAGNIKVGTAGGTDVNLLAKGGNIEATTVTADNDALLQTDTGNITFTSVTANQNADIKVTQQGDITGANTEATNGTLTVETAKGAIKLGKATVGTDLSLSNQNGGIELTDVAKAGQDAKLQTATGDIQLTGGMMAGNDVLLQTDTGNITFTDVTANRNADIKVTQQGDITGNNAEATTGTLTIETAQGTIKLGKTIAGKDISLTNRNGSIDLSGVATAGQDAKVQTATGNITFTDVTANRNADIKVSQQGNITGNDVKAVNDSFHIYTAKGDVNLRNVYAARSAEVGADEGKVTIFNINGENVIIRVKNKDNDLHVPNITAGKSIYIASSAFDVGEISQRPGYDGMLLFVPKSPDPNAPIKYFTLGGIKAQNGLQIEELWAERADVHVDSDRFYIDRLSITDTGHFSNNNTTVTVYGNSQPTLDDANFHFWYNPKQQSSRMYLHFLSTYRTVDSDGILLKKDDDFNIYGQHLSGVAETTVQVQRQMNPENLLTYQYLREPAVSYGNFEQVNLIDISQGSLPQVQPQIQPQVQPQVEPQPQPQVQPQVEPQIQPQAQPQVESQTQQQVQSQDEQQTQQQVQSRDEQQTQQPTDGNEEEELTER